jgi:hypothetical protein
MKFILSSNEKLVSTIAISTAAISLVVPSLALASGDVSVIGLQLYDKIALGGGLVVLIKGGVDIIQSALSSDWPKVKQTIMYSAGISIVLILYPTFLRLIEATAKGMR